MGVRGRRIRARVLMIAVDEFDFGVVRQMSIESGVLGERVKVII